MTKRKMFLRMITASLIRRRSRMLIALLAIAVGATILSGLVTIYYDVPRQMGAEFRNYGANMILLPDGEESFARKNADDAMSRIPASNLVGAAPYRYESVTINQQPIVAAGTDLEGVKLTSPYWHIEGEWPDATGELLVGKEIATMLSTKVGKELNVSFALTDEDTDHSDLFIKENRKAMTVVGILETGGSEEEYIYLAMEDLEELAGTEDKLSVAELSISANQEELQSYADTINNESEGVAARLVKRVTQSEATVLTKLQALVLLVTVVVLALTMICVATTMTAVVTERRKEIGLRKALGASDASVIWEFMGEGLLLGMIGGLLGAGFGFAFAQAVSMNVFSSSIVFRPLLLPLTVIVSILVTGLACLQPVRRATDVDPALVLKGE
ncbi:MAG: ABC transporter permease [Oscillospiraceae bacterium]|nr:ABC transporter permease [Oscillospiraceae bacterium]